MSGGACPPERIRTSSPPECGTRRTGEYLPTKCPISTHATVQRLQGKTALVTGGAQGFGKAIVSKFIAEGARVVVLDIVEPGPADSQGNFSTNVTYVSGDVTSPEDWQKALEMVTQILLSTIPVY
ncbi:hypothetical protein AnigIFM60653_009349 [Aspergillus niger]|nr:hypothetical protein AnigIFM60653_009349 [Aspergillus niger]